MTLVLRLLVLVSAIVQFVFPIFVNPFRDGGRGLGTATPVPLTPSQIEPAGYAFAIWGPIYLLAIVYAVWQLTPQGRRDPTTSRAAPLAIMLYAGSSLWLTAAAYGPLWATMPILAVMALSAVTVLVWATAQRDPVHVGPQPVSRSWAMIIPFGLYAGWTTCATFVNIAEVAPAYGFDRFGLGASSYAIASICAAAVAAGVVLFLTRGNLAFAATVAWALVAIAVAATTRSYPQQIVITAGLALAVVVSATMIIRRRSPAIG